MTMVFRYDAMHKKRPASREKTEGGQTGKGKSGRRARAMDSRVRRGTTNTKKGEKP